MHKFYERMQSVFDHHGSNRHRFCKKHGFNYQTLQSYWNTDRLPPGAVLEAIAREYNVSLDTLVLGRVPSVLPSESPQRARLSQLLGQLSDSDLLRVEGAVRMLQLLELSDGEWAELEELPTRSGSHADGSD